MKKITLRRGHNLALLFFLLMYSFSSAQCIRTAAFGSAVSNNSGVAQTITTCAYATEYSTVTGLLVGSNYLFSEQSGSTGGQGTHLFLTVTDLSNNVIAFGTSPLTIDAINTDSVRLHYADDSSCAGGNTCRNSQVKYLASCQAPTAVVASNITTTSATISWTASGTPPANGYEYYYATVNTAPTASTTPMGSVGADVLTVDLADLAIGTNYYIWVRSVCSDTDTSLWSTIANFSTACDPVTDFTENFDAAVAFPACWAKVGPLGSSYVQASATTTSTPNNLYIYSTSSASQAVVAMRPVSNAGDGTHRLRFRARGNFTAGDTVQVGYLTNPSDATTFVSLQEFTTTSTSVYDSFTAVLGTAPGANQVLAFRHKGTLGYSILIDDVVWEALPSCIEPTALTVTNVTESSATIAWTASVTPPANGYEYFYSTSNTAPTAATAAMGSVGANVLSADLTDLAASTVYYFWVRSVCSSSDSSVWSIRGTFTTPCPASTVPYSQDFESAVVPAIPSCTTIQNAGNGNNWTVASNPGYGFTSKTLRYAWNTTNAANAWFYTNGIQLNAGTSYTISYRYGNNSTTYVEKLKVSYGTSPVNTAMTTLVDHPSITGGTTTSTALQGLVEFTPNTSGIYYFGFNAYSDADQFYLLVDDISVVETLATPDFESNKFTFYPNPVKDVLNIGYSKTIAKVALFNIVGQEVLAKTINADQSQVDMSNLPKGTYLVKVTAENGAVKTIKVIKE
ncbi:T9SS type A sorting domain-containing protein [Flavobacterium silvisoli]|uniref:T9SS type A sorting domain-containing protein n=1 Tax=Flavobacterium silvisoli TaxID=2529433 RepID=A0A4Q9Z248_9FLAO|nr:fibronectin type III domain-containing protein [Flavobacterium silvisoli]TBX70172.1 T9SS type A sorting domain-containing protein [Flavobacterium silvisoli]